MTTSAPSRVRKPGVLPSNGIALVLDLRVACRTVARLQGIRTFDIAIGTGMSESTVRQALWLRNSRPTWVPLIAIAAYLGITITVQRPEDQA